jgi:hypothetical protein
VCMNCISDFLSGLCYLLNRISMVVDEEDGRWKKKMKQEQPE